LALGVSDPALAQSPGPPGNTVGAPGPIPQAQYPSGINVGNPGVPTTVTLAPGVVVNVTDPTIAQAVAISTGTAAGTGNPATLIANDAAVNLTTTSQFAGALFLHPIQGNATITASGRINLARPVHPP